MTPHATLYRDVYEFHKRHLASQDWPTITAEMQALEAKHGHSEFTGELLAAVVAELGRVSVKNDPRGY